MGMPSTESRRWSVEDVWALPDDGNRYETVDGELLVSPTPRLVHQQVVGEFYLGFGLWLRGAGKGIGVALMAPSDVILDAYTLVQPDLFDSVKNPQPARLDQALDAIRARFGNESVSRGTVWHRRHEDRDRLENQEDTA